MPRRKTKIRHHPLEEVAKNETDSGMAIVTRNRVVKKKLEQQKDFVLPESDPDDRSYPVSDNQLTEKSVTNELVDAVKTEPPPEPSFNLEDKNFVIEENEVKIEALKAEFPIKREPSPEPSFNLEDEKFTIEENDVKSEILNAELDNTDSQTVGIENKSEMVGTDDPHPAVVNLNQPEKVECNIKGKEKFPLKAVYCELCNKHFKYHYLYKRHQMIHSDKKPFSCDICSKAYKRKYSLLTHMKSHTDSRPFTCDICSMKFKMKYNLVSHMKTHSDNKPFSCDICSAKFRWKYYLAPHMKMSHSDSRPFTCDICNGKFKRKYYLVTHMMTHSDDRPFTCDICSFRCNFKQSLAIHMKSHSENKQHACPICQKRFTIKWNLRQHLITHEINPLICPVCHKKHSSTVSRKKHMRTHMTVKGPLKCEHCPKLFNSKKNIIKHYKLVHPPKKL